MRFEDDHGRRISHDFKGGGCGLLTVLSQHSPKETKESSLGENSR
jgi:hypothetical protein